MEEIGAFEAKTHLSQLLARVAEGESFLITKHGKPMARLVPDDRRSREKIESAAERLRGLRGVMKSGGLEALLEARHEGHRY